MTLPNFGSCLCLFCFIAPKNLNYLAFQSFGFESTRNVSCTLNLISTFSLVTFVFFIFFKLDICRYLVHVLCFIFYNLYLFTYTVVLHDIHNHNDVSRSTVTGRVPLVEQELLSLPEHMCSSPVFSGVRVSQSLVFCVVFCRSLFVF